MATDHLVDEGAAGHRNVEHFLASDFDRLLDGGRHLFGLAVPDADLAGAVVVDGRGENHRVDEVAVDQACGGRRQRAVQADGVGLRLQGGQVDAADAADDRSESVVDR